jgi:hypothetical protein
LRQRDKARTFKRFVAGWSVAQLAWTLPTKPEGYPQSDREKDVEAILREGLDGAFDLPIKQARAYAKAAGVKVERMVKV